MKSMPITEFETVEPILVRKGLPRILHRNGHTLDNRRPNLLVLPDVPHVADGKVHYTTVGVDGRTCYLEHVILGYDNPKESAPELEEECEVVGEGLEALGSPFPDEDQAEEEIGPALAY
jgi:hypothetical protein